MISTVDRGSFFAFTRCVNQPPSASNDDGGGYVEVEDQLPPSRCSSFKSVASSLSVASTCRRNGVVSERQLDSLQRRLVNYVQPTSSPPHQLATTAFVNRDFHRVVPDVPLSPIVQVPQLSNGSRHDIHVDGGPAPSFQERRTAPLMPPRRPVVVDRGSAVSAPFSSTSSPASLSRSNHEPPPPWMLSSLRGARQQQPSPSGTQRQTAELEPSRMPSSATVCRTAQSPSSSSAVFQRPSPSSSRHQVANSSSCNRQDYSSVLLNRSNCLPQPLGGDAAAAVASMDNHQSALTSSGNERSPTNSSGLESRLAEREAELRSLRETMERNEWAILKALEDQRRRADSDAVERKAQWNRRLAEMSSRATLERRTLSETIGRLTVENNELRSALNAARDRLDRQQLALRARRAGVGGSEGGERYGAATTFDSTYGWPVLRTRSEPDAVVAASLAATPEVERRLKISNNNDRMQVTDDVGSTLSASSSAGGRSVYAFLSECFTAASSGGTSKRLLDSNIGHGDNNEHIRSASIDGSAFVDADEKNRYHKSMQPTAASHPDIEAHLGRNGDRHCSTPDTVSLTNGSGVRGCAADATSSARWRTPEIATDGCQCCGDLRDCLERQRRDFDAERDRWLSEKRRVVDYQKLLQVGYVQLVKRCEVLEGRRREQRLPSVDFDVVGTDESRSTQHREPLSDTSLSNDGMLVKFTA